MAPSPYPTRYVVHTVVITHHNVVVELTEAEAAGMESTAMGKVRRMSATDVQKSGEARAPRLYVTEATPVPEHPVSPQ